MATMANVLKFLLISLILLSQILQCLTNDILGCGGFVKSHVSLDFSKIEIGLYTKEGSLKEKTECAPTNGYYFLPLYEKGEYVLKVHPPAGWSFEPSQVDLTVDGETDQCSSGQDINFAFNGFGITGRVITAGQKQGPNGISVQLVNDKGEVRETVTSAGGNFHFTPVIPGKYTVKASHPRWKLEPSQAVVQVKEGNTALPVGVLAVKGYDVTGSVTSFGGPISGIHVLLYSKDENPKFRVEGCKTALLQGVPDSPICYAVTDSSGEFKFGLVPAGEYKLLAMSKSPGQATLTYNIKPNAVPFTVQHDSIYIKNTFEVSGFSLVGSTLAAREGAGLAGVRVLSGGAPVATSDASGKFTLPALRPGAYALSFQHEQCEFENMELTVSPSGPVGAVAAVAGRWRVCGSLSPPAGPAPPPPLAVLLTPAEGPAGPAVRVVPDADGEWCTFLPPGVYIARVDVPEQEQREGLQFYPEEQKVTVGRASVSGVRFSQLRARLSGAVRCGGPCPDLAVTLRPLSADGAYVGQPRHTKVVDGEYTFEEVSAGSVEVSVDGARVCWAEARHNVPVAHAEVRVPPFLMRGLVLHVRASHGTQVEYRSESGNERGVLSVAAGPGAHCLPAAARYSLTPRGCHRFSPATATVDMAAYDGSPVELTAVSHAAVVQVVSSEATDDLRLDIRCGPRAERAGPLAPARRQQGYVYEHTLYLAEGEACEVSAVSGQLVFQGGAGGAGQGAGGAGGAGHRVVGSSRCGPVLTLSAARGTTLAGALVPPVPDVVITLKSVPEDIILTQITNEDGKYKFGPLDASKQYVITAQKQSYVFGERASDGSITAHKLAHIDVRLLDENEKPLEGALVSVSGGSFRRNAATGADGRLRAAALAPAQYYVRPNMKEYRFQPPHAVLPVAAGEAHALQFRGIRVAWSCMGRAVSLGGAPLPAVQLRARPAASTEARCPPQDATTAHTGHFRIRGLVPNCRYTLELKEARGAGGPPGIKLAKAPPVLEVKEKDIEDIRLIVIQPQESTDVGVLVHTPNVDHYRALRLTLAAEAAPHAHIYTMSKLDATGYDQHLNPGLLYTLPRLPADNKTYVLQLDSTLSKTTHVYDDVVHYFNSDGKFKSFHIDFSPKTRGSEQELRHTSALVGTLLAALALAAVYRAPLAAALAALLPALPAALTPPAPDRRAPRKRTH